LPRRSAGDIAHVVDRIVALLKQTPGGLREEQIRDKLGLVSKELPRPLKEALDAGRIAKSGQKRSTTYFINGAGPAAGAGSRARRFRPGRRPAARKSRASGRAGRSAPKPSRGPRQRQKKVQAPAAPAAPEHAS
jgi:hypothetical protein